MIFDVAGVNAWHSEGYDGEVGTVSTKGFASKPLKTMPYFLLLFTKSIMLSAERQPEGNKVCIGFDLFVTWRGYTHNADLCPFMWG